MPPLLGVGMRVEDRERLVRVEMKQDALMSRIDEVIESKADAKSFNMFKKITYGIWTAVFTLVSMIVAGK